MNPTDRASRARRLLWYWGPAVAFMVVIFAGSSISQLPAIPGDLSDKTAHGSEYAVLGLLLARAMAGPRWLSITLPPVAVAIVIAALYGVSDEYHQLLVPGRDFQVSDMVADATGASISAGSLWLLGIIRRHGFRQPSART